MKFKNEKEKEDIIKNLQLNMNEEFQATLQYICHRISALPREPVMADSFKSAALDEMAHILFFSDLICKYGGTPVFTDWKIDKSLEIKAMLEKDVALEKSAKMRYSGQIERFQDYPELITIIAAVLNDEEDHEAEFARYLENLST